MRTHYIKRAKANVSPQWGTYASVVQTALIRVTVSLDGKKHIWEWVATGREVDEANKQHLLKNYPICKFQDLEELAYRAAKNRQARGQQ